MKLMKVLGNFLGFYLGTGVVLWLVVIVAIIVLKVVMTNRYGERIREDWVDNLHEFSKRDSGLTYYDMMISLLAWPLFATVTMGLAWITLKEAENKLSRDEDLKKERGDS